MSESLKVGTLAYATDQGLGILAKSFADHGVVTDVLVVNHPVHPDHLEWYPAAAQTLLRPFNGSLVRTFCQGMDSMLFFETPFDWSLIPWCRSRGVKTVLMTMHECTPERLPALPDVLLCPSMLDFWCFRELGQAVFLPVPVDVPWRLRERAEVFVHNAGHGSFRGRNGTAELLKALPLMKNPVKLILRSQFPIADIVDGYPKTGKVQLSYRHGTVLWQTLWDEGDVFVFPEKFNGLCLPLQEARAAGMLAMGTDRFPINTWLPKEHLIPSMGCRRAKIAGHLREFDEAILEPKAIADKIDEWVGRDIIDESLAGKEWAKANSWDVLKPRYLEVLAK